MLRTQKLVPRIHPPLMHRIVGLMEKPALVDWSLRHYWNVASPDIVTAAPSPARRASVPTSAAA
jgi:hypothetical protein